MQPKTKPKLRWIQCKFLKFIIIIIKFIIKILLFLKNPGNTIVGKDGKKMVETVGKDVEKLEPGTLLVGM